MSDPQLPLRALCAILCLAACSAPPPAPDATPDAALDAVTDVAPVDLAPDLAADAPADRTPVADASLARCPGGVAMPYPTGDSLAYDAPLPDLTLPGDDGAVRLSAYYTPCASRPRVLVVRVFAPWSGPSRLHAAHTAELLARADADRFDVLDVLGRSQDNAVATARDLALFRPHYRGARAILALDTPYRFRSLFLGAGRLPLVLFVDPRTMRITRTLDVPETAEVGYELSVAIARLDGVRPPPRPETTLYDGRLSPDAWEMVRAMTLPGAPPPDPSNRVADDPAAASFGRSLFVDPQLSPRGAFSCATCHVAARGFTDHRRVAMAEGTGGRNTPAVTLSAHSRWLFWDGRADSLWAQALGPIENPREMASSRLDVAHYVFTQYATEYRALFGELPPLSDTGRFPAHGMPGTPAWSAMTAADQRAVDTVFVNVGKSLAAFERTLRLRASPFDAYVRGDVNALSAEARDGLQRFMEFGCIQCHHGPTLSDDSFHNLRFGTGQSDGLGDNGRIDGLTALQTSPFRLDGPFSDAPSAPLAFDPIESTRGQFHTPSLRDVAATGPWGHGGTYSDLDAVMLHYAQILTQPPAEATVGDVDPHVGNFHTVPAVLATLSALMRAMTAP